MEIHPTGGRRTTDRSTAWIGCWFVLHVCLLAACSGSPAADLGPHAFRTIQEDGVPVAVSSGVPRYEGELFEYDLLLTLQEGDDEDTIFFRPGQFTGDDEGWYYLTDSGHGAVMVFDEAGRFHHRFGREGRGPGEFRYPSITSIEDGVLQIYDSSQRRITRYRRDGELLDVTPGPITSRPVYNPNSFSSSVSRFFLLTDRRFLVTTSHYRSRNPVYERKIGAMLLSAEGDTLWHFQSDPVAIGYTYQVRQGDFEFESMGSYPFGPSISCQYHPVLGIVAISGWDPEIRIYSMEGELRRIIRIERPPEPLTEELRSTVRAYFQDLLGDEETTEDSKIFLEQQLKNLKFTEMRAPWFTMKFDEEGYIYLGRQETYDYRSLYKQLVYEVLSPEGEYLGKTAWPGGLRSEVAGGRLLANETDLEEGEYAFNVYAMRPIPAGFKFP